MGCGKSKQNLLDEPINEYYWQSRNDCCICLDKKSNMLLLPCNHVCICDYCCRDLIESNFSNCPLCQQEVYSCNLLQIIPAVPNN